MRAVLSGVRLRHKNVADLAGVRPRRHCTDSIGKVRRSHSSKIGAGLVHGGISKIIVGPVDGPKMNLIWRRTRRRRMAVAMMTEKRLQIVEIELMKKTGEVKLTDGGFFHDIAPVLFFFLFSPIVKKNLFSESGLSMRAK